MDLPVNHIEYVYLHLYININIYTSIDTSIYIPVPPTIQQKKLSHPIPSDGRGADEPNQLLPTENRSDLILCNQNSTRDNPRIPSHSFHLLVPIQSIFSPQSQSSTPSIHSHTAPLPFVFRGRAGQDQDQDQHNFLMLEWKPTDRPTDRPEKNHTIRSTQVKQLSLGDPGKLFFF